MKHLVAAASTRANTSAFKVLKKFNTGRKNRRKAGNTLTIERSSSTDQPTKNGGSFDTDTEAFHRRRAYTDSVTKPNIKDASTTPAQTEEAYHSQFSGLEDMLISPRHYLRRKALVESELQDGVNSSYIIKSIDQCSIDCFDESNSLILCVDVEGYKMTDSVETMPSHSLCDMIEYLFMKDDIELKYPLKDYSITASLSNKPVIVDLDRPSTDYILCIIKIRARDGKSENDPKHDKETNDKGDNKGTELHTVKECLNYFDIHGLNELPLLNHSEEDSYHLPRVTPLDPIVDEWESLPISPRVRNLMTSKDVEQQRTIWELIHTEHSHLQTLETIINVFMRCLELIRRTGLLSEDNYHNIFGCMEDLYHAHEQLWTYTFEPCLNKTYETNLPLDLEEIISRFPKPFGDHFEVYEQHTALENVNMSVLKKAMSNPDFNAYIKWCEASPKCNRLGLKQLLATPFQRLTKYSLCVGAIIKKTASISQKENLSKILDDINAFLHMVNNGIRIQQETERVKDAMNRITAYSVVDIPPELKDLVQCHTHLDLLAPMLDVELDKPRLLMVEGSILYRDNVKPKTSTVYIFLFTDMLLVTKPTNRKASNNTYTVVRPPFKVTSLNLHTLDSETICCLVMTEYNVLSSWFILKAHNPIVAKEWLNQISAAQQFYQDAIDKKTQTWKLMENLRSERILNGVESLGSLSTSISQSLWSIHSLTNNEGLGRKSSSNDMKRSSTPSLVATPHTTTSGDMHNIRNMRSSFSRSMAGSVDLTNTSYNSALSLERTSSLGRLSERTRSLCERSMSTISESKLLSSAHYAPLRSSSSESRVNVNFHENLGSKLGEDDGSLRVSGAKGGVMGSSDLFPQKSSISDDSGTESNGTSIDDSFSRGAFERDVSSGSVPPKKRLHEKYLSDTLPCKIKSCDMYHRKRLFPLASRSMGDLMEGSNEEFVKTASPFSKSDHHLKSILHRSPSPRVLLESRPPCLSRNSCSDLDIFAQRSVDRKPPHRRPKYPSAGCLEAPNIFQLSLSHPSPVLQQRNSICLPISSPHRDPKSFKSPQLRCPSENSLHGSYPNSFNVAYVKENGGKKKSDVAPSKEEEIPAMNSDNCSVMIPVDSDDVGFPSMVVDSSNESASQKISSKAKVMFSELTEVRSFSNEENESEDLNTPEKFPLVPGWSSKSAAEKRLSSVKTESAESAETKTDISIDAHHESSDCTTNKTEAESSRRGKEDIQGEGDIVADSPAEERTTLSGIQCQFNMNQSNSSTAPTSTKSIPRITSINKSVKSRYLDFTQKERLSFPRTPLKSKKEIKKTSLVRQPGRSVRELSLMFDSPSRSPVSHTSPSPSPSPTPLTSPPHAKQAPPSTTTTPTKSVTKPLPHAMGIKRTTNPKRKESSSAAKLPSANQSMPERKRSHMTATYRKSSAPSPSSSSSSTAERGKVLRSPEPVTSLIPPPSTPLRQKTSHPSSVGKNDPKTSDLKVKNSRIQRPQRIPNPISKPKSTTKREIPFRIKPHPPKTDSGSGSGSGSGATKEPTPTSRSRNVVLRNNSNGNNKDCNETENSAEKITQSSTAENLRSVETAGVGRDRQQTLTTIFRPKREYVFDKCLPSFTSFGFRSQLRHHRSFEEETESTLLTKKMKSRNTCEWQNFGIRDSSEVDQLSNHQWKQIR